MYAIQVRDDDDRTLAWEEVPTPSPSRGQVLISIAAAGVNRLDLLQRAGRYPVPEGESTILGVEAAGEIIELGDDVDGWHVGDRVCALLGGGGYAEYAVVPASMLLDVPRSMSDVEAAALPEVLYTAYLNLFVEGELAAGETVLIHAGASGVGTMAIQLALERRARVLATASTAKQETLRSLGAVAIDRIEEDFAERVRALTDGDGVDVILDPVGGGYLERNIRSLRRGGRLVVIGLLGGANDTLPIARLLMRRLRVIGSVLRSRSRAEKAAITEKIRADAWPAVRAGAIDPVVDATFPIQRAAEAHDRMRRNETRGKLILTID